MEQETVVSAIRSRDCEGQTFVHTNRGRWLLVSGYAAEWEAARVLASRSPRVANLRIIGRSTEAEFQSHCVA